MYKLVFLYRNICFRVIGGEPSFSRFSIWDFPIILKTAARWAGYSVNHSGLFYLEYAMCLRTRCVCQSECPKQQTTRQNLCFGSIHTGNTLNGIFSRYFPFWYPGKANKVDELVDRRRDREGVKEWKKKKKTTKREIRLTDSKNGYFERTLSFPHFDIYIYVSVNRDGEKKEIPILHT